MKCMLLMSRGKLYYICAITSVCFHILVVSFSIFHYRYEKQLKEFKEKGYYTMEGGIKSTDMADPKKKKEKSESKPSGEKKRSSSVAVAGKGKAAAADKKGGKVAASGKKKET
jgi:hypothetical protein